MSDGWIETPMRNKIKVPLEWRRMRLVSGRSELKVLGLGIGTKWLEPEGRVGLQEGVVQVHRSRGSGM